MNTYNPNQELIATLPSPEDGLVNYRSTEVARATRGFLGVLENTHDEGGIGSEVPTLGAAAVVEGEETGVDYASAA